MPLFAIAILVFSRSRGLVAKFLSTPLMVWLGEISYAFYLVHQIVIRALHHRMLDAWTTAALAFLIALFASAVLYRFVEVPGKAVMLGLLSRRERPASQRRRVRPMGGWSSLHVVALVILLMFVAFARPGDPDQGRIRQIISATPDHLRNVQFVDEARLLGFQVEKGDRGRMLHLVWSLEPQRSRSRFIHVVNDRGEIVSQLPLRDLAATGNDGRPILESVWISNERLYRSALVGVGFWSQEKGAARIAGDLPEESLGMQGSRLEIERIPQRRWR
jgi:hypothetical protein